jgi:hypothetical protein
MASTVTVASTSSVPLIQSSANFRGEFDLRPFEFEHSLSSHPLFELSRLLQLAQSTRATRPGDLYYDAGEIRVDQRWDETGPKTIPMEQAMENIESTGAWIILKRVERDPEYAQLLHDCMAEAENYLDRDIRKDLRVAQDGIIFVSSPNRITSYHIDRECSFLMQIRGNKSISIFDRDDREVLTQEELERFWTIDNNAARYKPDLQEHANVFELRPGTGVHIPVNCPHWLKNGNNVSISFNINCQFKDHFRANLYRANFALRTLGLRPTPPGQSRFRDAIKRTVVGGMVNRAVRVRHALQNAAARHA